ncbi:MAG: DUF5666 domain-containing protein [Acidimicrobiales bacterium]
MNIDNTTSGAAGSAGCHHCSTRVITGALPGALLRMGALAGVVLVAAACSSGSSTAVTTAPAAPAKSDSHAGHAHGVAGVVSSLGSAEMTIHTKGSSLSVVLTSATKYREAGRSVSESALSRGEHVRVGLVKSSSTPTAARILILPPSVSGSIATLSTTGFTLSAKSGTSYSVVISPSTVYRSGKQPASVSSLRVGEHVRVTGTSPSSGSVDATAVTIIPTKGGRTSG